MKKEDALKAIAARLRYHSVAMTTTAGSGHPTSCLSMADLMACLFFDEMKYDVKNPNNAANDEFVLSKGHAAPILYAAYAEAGVLPVEQLGTLRKFGSPLEGHPTPNFPWVKAATGSLGQGLSVGVGMAMAMRMQKIDSRVFVLLGDGELAEGAVWEAAELAAKESVNNLVAIVDANRLGQSGESLHGHAVNRWRQKFVAFGWHAQVINGHDIKQILDALSLARTTPYPCVIIAKTNKGHGVSFAEGQENRHGKAFKDAEAGRALSELPFPEIDAKKYVRAPSKPRMSKLHAKGMAKPNYKKEDVVATRQAFGNALVKLGEANKEIVVLDGDVKNSTYTELFFEKFPERSIECYIAEQNMIGVSVGLAVKGFTPISATFAAFLTRAHDQIRMAAYSLANIKVCGSHCGVSIGEDGPSQMGLEDVALFRSVPNCVVLYPSDAVSAEKCTELAVNHNGICYIRTTRPKTKLLYRNGESFKIGGSKTVRKSFFDKAVVVAAGITVHEAIKAADKLKEEKIHVRVIDAYSIKPLDESIASAAKGRPVIVVEDHFPEGGLGEAVASLGIPITHLAVNNIPRSGKPEELLHAYKIDADAIVHAVKKALR